MSPVPKDASEILLAVADTAVVWWAMKRPIAWSLENHLQSPTINCSTGEEKHLAKAAAKWAEFNGRKR